MASVVNRSTKEFFLSVNEPDYPLTNWIHNPDMSAVSGFASKYWVITGDAVTLMDQAARDAVDVSEAVALTSGNRLEAVNVLVQSDGTGVRVRALIELFNKRDNYLTSRIVELQDALTAMKATTGAADNIRGAIPASWLNTNTRPRFDAAQDYTDSVNSGGVD